MKTQLEWIYFFPLSRAENSATVQGGTNAGGMIFMTNWVILILIQDS